MDPYTFNEGSPSPKRAKKTPTKSPRVVYSPASTKKPSPVKDGRWRSVRRPLWGKDSRPSASRNILDAEAIAFLSSPNSAKIQSPEKKKEKRKEEINKKEENEPKPVALVERSEESRFKDRDTPDTTIDAAYTEIMKKLSTGYLPNDPNEVLGLDTAKADMFEILERTVDRGESHSALIQGPHGSGKSFIINLGLAYIRKKYENIPITVVKLDGLIHDSDSRSLRAFIAQLGGKERSVTSIDSYSDTISECLEECRKNLRNTAKKPIIIILENFAEFTARPRQSLLYSLFEVCRQKNANVAVIGTVVRIDVLELLEKRVKSRFSQRQIRVSCPQSLPVIINTLQSRLHLTGSTQFAKAHNDRINTILEDPVVLKGFEYLYANNCSLEYVGLRVARDAIGRWKMSEMFGNDKSSHVSANHFHAAFGYLNVNVKELLLQDLSVLELCLVIACKRLLEKGTIQYNFEMIHDEYRKFANSSSTGYAVKQVECYSKAVCFKGLEHLIEVELLSVSGSGTAVQRRAKQYRDVQLLMHPSEVQEAILRYKGCPTLVKHWATQWLAP